MARLDRKTQKVFAINSADNGQFGAARAGTFTLSNDVDVIQALNAWLQGWNEATVSGDKVPPQEELQAVQYVITRQLAYMFQEGIPEYDEDTTYYERSIVKDPESLKLYSSLVDDNQGNALTDNASWLFLGDLSQISKLNNYTASDAPTVNDDSGDGYSPGSIWYIVSGGDEGDTYLCTDATLGAAVWVDITLSVSSLGTAAFKDFGVSTGQLVELENVGGSPGLPAIDGSQLTDIQTSADLISYDNAISGLSATEVQSAIDEIEGSLGTAAAEDVGISIGNVVQLIDDGGGNPVLPALDGSKLVNIARHDTVDPTSSDDDTEGFSIGSIWVNTTTNVSYICLDNATGTAIWREITNTLNNYTASDAPTVNDDSGDGYSPGSIWYISSGSDSGDSFLCTDATLGAAVWIPTSLSVGDLGTAAFKDFGISIGNLIEIQNVGGNPGLPAIDGSQITGLDAASIGDGSVSNTEFQFLDSVSSNIQSQLDGKQASGNYITALSGDVTASGPGSVTATIANGAITNAKMASVSQNTIKGRVASGSGSPTDLTLTQVLDMIGPAAQGDILYRGSSSWERLAAGAADSLFQTKGSGQNPVYASIESVRSIPQNSQSTGYTLILSDAGKHILHPSADTTGRTFTIPANSSVPFPVGTAITFINQNGAGVITISITTDTMRLAGSGTTGNRSLAANGIATALKITSTEWIISGTGLS